MTDPAKFETTHFLTTHFWIPRAKKQASNRVSQYFAVTNQSRGFCLQKAAGTHGEKFKV